MLGKPIVDFKDFEKSTGHIKANLEIRGMNDEVSAPMTTGNPNDAAAAELLPFSNKQVVLSLAGFIQLKWDANHWKVQHERSCAREEKLKQQLVRKTAQIREPKQRLFGKQSEKGMVSWDQVDPES